MPRKKGKTNTPHEIIEEIMEKHEKEGKSTRELAEEYNKPLKTIRNMVTREHNKQKKINAGIMLNKIGRPSKDFPVEEADKITQLKYKLSRKDARIKQLEMENELLRDFLKETGRG